MEFTTYMDSPLGTLEIAGTDTQLTRVLFRGARHKPAPEHPASEGLPPESVTKTIGQLNEYFAGKRQGFDVPLSPEGTVFQQKIWKLLLDIPYGRTISYAELSKRYGDMKAIRAVGTANGSNPISIIIPCHRVIGSNGSLVGYGGDLWRKEWLLKHEIEHGDVGDGRLF
jgi:methylated-DNA-[protein]-cysteine S-methyltransferase